jgi:hypothetical protein
MRTIQRPKKQNQWFFVSAAQVLSLLIVFGIGGCKGCGQQNENDTSINLSMTLSKNSIVDHEKFIVNIKNEAEKIAGEEVANEASLQKAKLMIKFLTGETGSQFVFEDETGTRIEEREINRPLDEFKGNGTLTAQETKSIEISLIPGPGVTSAEIEITLVTLKGDKETVETEKVTWTKTLAAELKLIPIVDAIDNDPGKFAVKVEKADIQPSEIQVSWISEHGTVFNLAGKFIGTNPTLKDLLGNDDGIKAGAQSGEINYTLSGVAPAFNLATITLSLKKSGQELLSSTANTLTWNAKDLDLKLIVTVVGKDINYEVTKKSDIDVDDTNDKIEIVYEKTTASNAATLARTGVGTENTAGTVLLKKGDFDNSTNQAQGKLAVDLKTDKSVVVKFTLKYNGTNLATKTAEVKKDIQLSIGQIKHDRTGSNKVIVEINNTGVDEAKGVKLAYTTTSLATIDAQKTAFKENLDIAGSSQVEIEWGLLDLKGENSAEFTFTLEDGATKLEEKTHTFTAKDLQITLTVGVYNAEQGTVEVTMENTGKAAVEVGDNLVLYYSLDNGALFKTLLATSGSDKINVLAHTNGEFKKTIIIDLNDKASSTLTLQLKLNDKDLGAAKSVNCQEDVQLNSKFVDTDLTGKPTLKIEYPVENTGKNAAAKDNLRVKLIRKKGTDSTINSVNPGSAVDASKVLIPTAGVADQSIENIIELTLEPNGDTDVEIGVQLIYRGVEVGDVKTIIWKKQEPKLAITELAQAILEGAEKTFKYKLGNTGTGKAERDRIKLKVTNKSAEGVTVAGEPIAHGASVELTYDKLGIVAEIVETNGKTAELNLTIDPQTNGKVSLGLEPMYDTAVQGVAQVVSWKADPVVESKIVMNGAETSFKEQLAKIIFTNKTGRELTIEDLKVLTLHSTAAVNIHDKKGDINGVTLEKLAQPLTSVAKDGIIEIDVILSRTDNTDKEVTNLEVKKVGKVVTKGPFAKLVWPASALKFASKIAMVGAPKSLKEQPAKITLTNKSGRELKVEELSVLTVDYDALGVEIHDANKLIKGQALEDLALVKPLELVADNGEIEIEVTLERVDNTKREITSLEVKAGNTVVTDGTFAKLDWEAAPKVTLSSQGNKVAFVNGNKTLTLVISTDKDLDEAALQKVKIVFEVIDASGNVKTDNTMLVKKAGKAEIQDQALDVVFGITELKAGKTKEVQLDFGLAVLKGKNKITIALVGVDYSLELDNPLEVTKKVS